MVPLFVFLVHLVLQVATDGRRTFSAGNQAEDPVCNYSIMSSKRDFSRWHLSFFFVLSAFLTVSILLAFCSDLYGSARPLNSKRDINTLEMLLHREEDC